MNETTLVKITPVHVNDLGLTDIDIADDLRYVQTFAYAAISSDLRASFSDDDWYQVELAGKGIMRGDFEQWTTSSRVMWFWLDPEGDHNDYAWYPEVESYVPYLVGVAGRHRLIGVTEPNVGGEDDEGNVTYVQFNKAAIISIDDLPRRFRIVSDHADN